MQTMKYNEKIIEKRGLHLDNPALDAMGNIVSVTTNVPLDRVVSKLNNIQMALETDLEAWQRTWLMLGWNRYNLGIDDPDINMLKEQIKKEKKKKKKKKKVGGYGPPTPYK
jgi:hypothetical protein